MAKFDAKSFNGKTEAIFSGMYKMINAIVEAISISLDAEFGEKYSIYREEKQQGLKEPCFFIFCVHPTHTLFLKQKYARTNQFCIHYFPEHPEREKEECAAVAERLFSCLEHLNVEGCSIAGTKMNYEIVDGVLHFFVNYDFFVCKRTEGAPWMREVSEKTSLKG